MDRIPEPELMDEPEQADAYAAADFEQPHSWFMEQFRERFPNRDIHGPVLDLGCGPGDITLRFARAFPHCLIDGVEGASAMLRHGRDAVRRAGMAGRVRLIHAHLPGARLPHSRYAAVVSNSLLHHLHDPAVLWDAVKSYAASGAPVFIMDLMRPADRARAEALTNEYAGEEPQVLQRDFFNSLLAAYRVDEVRGQLAGSGLEDFQVRAASDRHLIVSGVMP